MRPRGAARRRPQWLVASLRPDGTWDVWQGGGMRQAQERVSFAAKTLRGKFSAHLLATPEMGVTVYGPDGEQLKAAPVAQGRLMGFDPYNAGG